MGSSSNPSVFTDLATYLAESGYIFICPTPESQKRVITKRNRDASAKYSLTLEDIFGWSLPAKEKTFDELLPQALRQRLNEATIVSKSEEDEDGNLLIKSKFRVSNLYTPRVHTDTDSTTSNSTPIYYFHSAFPTTQSDAVFFGPDTYLYLDFLALDISRLLESKPRCIVDVCCGSGAGAIHMARSYPRSQVLGLDLNPLALDLGRINAGLASCEVSFLESNLFKAVEGRSDIDVIVSNPPYIASSTGDAVPVYAAGGASQGLELPMRIVNEGVKLLAGGGYLMMYTGVPMTFLRPRQDPMLEFLKQVQGVEVVSYRILHPDMFGEELSSPAYGNVGRIQVVGFVLKKIV